MVVKKGKKSRVNVVVARSTKEDSPKKYPTARTLLMICKQRINLIYIISLCVKIEMLVFTRASETYSLWGVLEEEAAKVCWVVRGTDSRLELVNGLHLTVACWQKDLAQLTGGAEHVTVW